MRAIDIHTHPPMEPGAETASYQRSMQRYFRSESSPPTPAEMAKVYQDLDIFAVVFTVDTSSAQGNISTSNEFVAKMVKRYPKTFMGFASVDPWMGKAAVRELERCVIELGLKGLKLMPNTQEFFPNDQRFYPLYEKCVELKIPVLIHSGTTGAGAGAPGGSGIHLKYSAPIPYIDDVAADFPGLTIIMAHPGWPWQEEQLAVAVHKTNVYIDLSGWSPKYFTPTLIQYANTLLQDRVLFGSDYPLISPERWLRDFAAAPFREEVRPKILLENAKRLLGLG